MQNNLTEGQSRYRKYKESYRRYREFHRDKMVEYRLQAKSTRSKKTRKHLVELSRINRDKYPKKYIARAKLNNEIKMGKKIRGKCWCGESKSEGHHTDYTRPLNVVWLCHYHHEKHHMDFEYLNNFYLGT